MTGEPSGTRAVAAKDALRRIIRVRRSGRLPDGDRARRAFDLSTGCAVVAAYASVPGEPDCWELIDSLAAGGSRILLPVLGRQPNWGWYDGRDQLVPSWRGIRQPAGEPLGAAALALADWIWIPGLAATPRGERLGTGGGWYDRALKWARPDAPVGVLLFDGELLDAVPTEPWDRPVDWILTASGTFQRE